MLEWLHFTGFAVIKWYRPLHLPIFCIITNPDLQFKPNQTTLRQLGMPLDAFTCSFIYLFIYFVHWVEVCAPLGVIGVVLLIWFHHSSAFHVFWWCDDQTVNNIHIRAKGMIKFVILPFAVKLQKQSLCAFMSYFKHNLKWKVKLQVIISCNTLEMFSKHEDKLNFFFLQNHSICWKYIVFQKDGTINLFNWF